MDAAGPPEASEPHQGEEAAPASASAETAAAAPPQQQDARPDVAAAGGGESAAAAAAADDLGDAMPPAPASCSAGQPGVERITPDGLVLKVVLEEGQGELPALHSQCLVHFVGRVLEEQKAPPGAEKKQKDTQDEAAAGDAGAGDRAETAAAPPPPPPAPSVWAPAPDAAPFMDTRDEGAGCAGSAPVQLVAGRRIATGREAGLSLALAAMRRGERALVYVLDPSYGYGPKGSFSFPSVPPDSRLAYDVRMVAWEAPDDGEEGEGEGEGGGGALASSSSARAAGAPRRGLLFEERLEAAERRRLRGNARFAAGDLPAALSCYAFALSYVDDDLLMQLEEGTPHLKAAEAVLAPTHLNIAAAHLALGDFARAVEACGKALEFDEGSAKAFFRRGKARLGLGQTREAVGDLEAAQKLLEKQRAAAALSAASASAAAASAAGAAAAAGADGAGGAAGAAAAAPSSSSSASLAGDAAAVARELAAARRLLREEGRAGDRVLTAALRRELGPSSAAKAKAAAAAAGGAAAGGAAAGSAAATATAAAATERRPLSSLMAMLEALLEWLCDLLRRAIPVAAAPAPAAAAPT